MTDAERRERAAREWTVSTGSAPGAIPQRFVEGHTAGQVHGERWATERIADWFSVRLLAHTGIYNTEKIMREFDEWLKGQDE